jgi:hypothetical protein
MNGLVDCQIVRWRLARNGYDLEISENIHLNYGYSLEEISQARCCF